MEDDPLPEFNRRGRVDCPSAIRSVTLSVPQLSDAAAFFETGIGLQGKHRRPSHARARGVVGPGGCHHGEQTVRRRRGADRGGAVPRSRLESRGPTTIACQTRASSTSRSARAASRTSTRSIDVPKRLAPSPIADPFTYPAPARWFTSTIRTAFRSRSCERRLDWPTGSSDSSHDPYTSARIRIRAGSNTGSRSTHRPTKCGTQITDQDTMARWIGFDPVTVRKEGWTQRHGAGSERLMQGPRGVGQVVEQVIATSPQQSLRYRVIEGSPLTCHQGEITLKQSGGHTELHWSIRFRPKVAGTGALLQKVLQARLRTMLDDHLKPYIENSTAAGVFHDAGIGEHRNGGQMNANPHGPHHVGVLIIGAGFSGLGAAIALQKDGYTDFLVVERGNNVGGTWRVNTYPGAACDVPSHLYSYSFAPNRKWTRSYSKQPEIEAYIRQVARQHQVLDKHRFGCEVHEVRWNAQEARWHVEHLPGGLHGEFRGLGRGSADRAGIAGH